MAILTKQQLEEVYSILSPNYSSQYLLEQYFPVADYGDENKWVDIHNKLIMNLLKLPRQGSLLYNNAKPVTTHSYSYYGTVSLWWLIIYCSDYVHPHCIPNNTIIKVPLLNVVSSYLSNDVDTGLSGKTIII